MKNREAVLFTWELPFFHALPARYIPGKGDRIPGGMPSGRCPFGA